MGREEFNRYCLEKYTTLCSLFFNFFFIPLLCTYCYVLNTICILLPLLYSLLLFPSLIIIYSSSFSSSFWFFIKKIIIFISLITWLPHWIKGRSVVESRIIKDHHIRYAKTRRFVSTSPEALHCTIYGAAFLTRVQMKACLIAYHKVFFLWH